MARTATEHYDCIKADLDRLHEAYPDSPIVTSLHACLGDAWDDYRAEHGDDSPGQANRSGGGEKDPPPPPPPPGA